jgi:hypothetical protein
VLPSELGLNGFDDGTKLFIHVALGELSTLLSFRTGADRAANEVYAIRLARGNEKIVYEACRSEQENTIEVQARRYQGLWNAYEATMERANLGSFGEGGTWLEYTTWAYRAGKVVSSMETDLQTAQSGSTLEPAAQNYVERIVDAQVELTNAWVDFRSASQRQSQTAFDDASQGVYEAEDGLERAVSVSPSDFAAAACLESVQ